jgi:hypothetical protein
MRPTRCSLGDLQFAIALAFVASALARGPQPRSGPNSLATNQSSETAPEPVMPFGTRSDNVRKATGSFQALIGYKPFAYQLKVKPSGELGGCAILSVDGKPVGAADLAEGAREEFCGAVQRERFEARPHAYSIRIAITAPNLK